MAIYPKKLPAAPKCQRSIFEFTKTEIDTTQEANIRSSKEVIDLTRDGELYDIKAESIDDNLEIEGSEIPNQAKEGIDQVKCPVCNNNLVDLNMDDRIRHVEECLSLVTLNDNSIPKDEPNETLRKEVSDKDGSNSSSNKRKKKEAPPLIKEKEKYVNKRVKVEISKPKIIKPPTAITTTKRRSPIPEVKILSFPSSKNEVYQVSVDAFNYMPHETITQHFLTHFHSDHYGGISKNWCYERVFGEGGDIGDESNYKKIIYCTTITAKLLTLRFSVDPKFIQPLDMNKRYLIRDFSSLDSDISECNNTTSPGLFVTPITANHCPGSAIFLFESLSIDGSEYRILHCGDFRVNREILDNPMIAPFNIQNTNDLHLDKVYLDTTYMSPLYNFPKQELVCETISDMFYNLTYEKDEENSNESLFSNWFGILKQSRITDFISSLENRTKKKKFLILVGTYVIGKEKLAISILQRLNNCPIFVLGINSRGDKVDFIKTFEDNYLNLVLTTNDLGNPEADCVIHLVPMKIVSAIDELSNYFNHNRYFEYFERCVGLRPTGWTFLSGRGSTITGEKGNERKEEEEEEVASMNLDGYADYDNFSQSCRCIIQLLKEQPKFSFVDDILAQAPLSSIVSRQKKGKPDESLYRIYTLPYSEHSSYRELSFFAIFLKIREIIPTVNISNESSIMRMKDIINFWESIKNLKTNKEPCHDIDNNVLKCIQNLRIDDF